MQTYLLYALPLAVVWMGVTSKITLENFILGYVIGFALMVFTQAGPRRLHWRQFPGQVAALVVYLAILFRDIVLSSIDVTRRVLSPKLDITPGVIAVSTQDPHKNEVVTAMSSIFITLTPGELVMEVEEDDDKAVMYVHTLDVAQTVAQAEQAQAHRLNLLYRILGDRV